MLSKALVVGAYQRKLEEIAQHPDIELTCVVPPRWGGQELERAYTAGYRLEVRPLRFAHSFHLFHWTGLGSLMRSIRPQVVHVDEEPYNLATFLAVRQARAVAATALFFSWQNLLRQYPLPFSWMERQVYRASPYAIAGGEEAGGILRAKGYRGRLAVIPQIGIDPELFAPAPTPRSDRPFTIGYAGRLIRAKGVSVLLDAVAGLRADWRLRLIGDGPERDSLAAQAERLHVVDRVTFLGGAPSLEMPARLRDLDVLAVPSLTTSAWKEQFGRVLVEAMACQVPVIGSNSGEIPHVIGDAGLVTPEGDWKALREALQRLADFPDARVDLGRRGRARALERFTHRRIAEQTVAVYRAVTV